MGTCIGFLFDLFGLLASEERPWKGFLLTCLGASLVYPLAAWQGYLGTSVWFLFDLFWVPGLFCERPWQGSLGTCVGLLFELFGCLPASGERPWKGFLLTSLAARWR